MFEKLRLHRSIAALSAAALTALGVGGIAIAQNGALTTPATTATQVEQPQGAEAAETSERADGKETEEQPLTGPSAERAKAAALAEVGSGKVTDVSSETEEADDPKEAVNPKEADDPKEANEPKDQADPAYQAAIAYSVEVTKADGSAVDVHLDKQFKVLGTEKAQQDEGEHGPNG
jgi:hypothetical protein